METGRSESLFAEPRDLVIQDDDDAEFDFQEGESLPAAEKKQLLSKKPKNRLKNSNSMYFNQRNRKFQLDELIEMEIAEHKSHNNSTH